MDHSDTELGRWGEKQARRFLKRQGYRILQKNVVTPLGEIDIVAVDGDVLVFVEVKTRTTDEFGGPLTAVGRAKRRKVIQTARGYLARHATPDTPCRFDVVGVTCVEGQETPEIELVRDAFSLNQ